MINGVDFVLFGAGHFVSLGFFPDGDAVGWM
jgi:hypothetical protein